MSRLPLLVIAPLRLERAALRRGLPEAIGAALRRGRRPGAGDGAGRRARTGPRCRGRRLLRCGRPLAARRGRGGRRRAARSGRRHQLRRSAPRRGAHRPGGRARVHGAGGLRRSRGTGRRARDAGARGRTDGRHGVGVAGGRPRRGGRSPSCAWCSTRRRASSTGRSLRSPAVSLPGVPCAARRPRWRFGPVRRATTLRSRVGLSRPASEGRVPAAARRPGRPTHEAGQRHATGPADHVRLRRRHRRFAR